MQELLKRHQRHLLWKDELGDPFILTKYGGIYRDGEETLKIHTWSKLYAERVAELVPILKKDSTDDPLWLLTVKVSDLGQILQLGQHFRRPYKGGAWLRRAEKALAHKIIPHRAKWPLKAVFSHDF